MKRIDENNKKSYFYFPQGVRIIVVIIMKGNANIGIHTRPIVSLLSLGKYFFLFCVHFKRPKKCILAKNAQFLGFRYWKG